MTLVELAEKIDVIVMDYNGTLAADGDLLPGLFETLRNLSKNFDLVVATADTFGSAAKNLKGLDLKIVTIETGKDKSEIVSALKAQNKIILAIGNSKSDVEMFKAADLSIAVIGPEGTFSRLLEHSTLIVSEVAHALQLPMNPKKMKATLRE
jgi:soluble P-type ATPase